MSKPIWIQIYEDLKEGIDSGLYSPETPLPPEVKIAAKWGVSRLTAHRALYELQRAGLVTRKRKVGTVVTGSKPVDSGRIGALFFHAGDYFQGNLLAAVRGGLAETFHLSYVDTEREAVTEAVALRRMRNEADGIVIYPTCDPVNNALLAEIVAEGVPIVCVDRHPPEIEIDSVQTDNYAAAFRVIQSLVQDGHARIACFCDHEETVSSTGDRVRAYRDLLEMAGGDQHRHYFAFPYMSPDLEYRKLVEMVRDSMRGMMERSDAPTAVFCTREHYASAVVESCGDLGIAIPDQLQIAAFVDRPSYLMALPDSVRRVTQDLAEIGRIAAERITRRLGGESLSAEKILVPPVTG